MAEITDLVTLNAYLKTVADSIPGLDFEYLDAGEEFDKEIQGYFSSRYKGPVLFFGMFEAVLTNNQSGYWENTFQGHLSVQVKAESEKPLDKLNARNQAWIKIMKVIGKIRMDYEDSIRIPGQRKHIFCIYEESLKVTDRIQSVNAFGWDFEFELGIPVNELLFT